MYMGAASGSQISSKANIKAPSRSGAGYRANLVRLGFKNLGLYRLAENGKYYG